MRRGDLKKALNIYGESMMKNNLIGLVVSLALLLPAGFAAGIYYGSCLL